MTVSNDLLMAILAMDSYNRGYNPGIDDGISESEGQADGLGGAGSKIGNATVKPINLPVGSQEAWLLSHRLRLERSDGHFIPRDRQHFLCALVE
ncbi:hypothetical protein [Rhizobium rhizosphaerae]|uniref:hypothetical protein n=1 Tax=Xaviernesmea rhizosphaerae TaxID=1672749 RepID=UPI00117B2111|nr:hypothetical protein [Xaviernesmea rhizosphaerae]